MFSLHDRKKAAAFIVLIFGSYLFSPALFLNLSALLAALLVGFAARREAVPLLVVTALFTLMIAMNSSIIFNFNAFYPFILSGIMLVVMRHFPDVTKGSLLFFSMLGTALALIVYMQFMETRFQLLTHTINGAMAEIDTTKNMLKSLLSEEDLKEYVAFSKKLIGDYYPFIMLFQYVVLTVVNLYLIHRLFPGLPSPLAEEFRDLRIPFHGVWGINAGILVLLLAEGRVSILGMNGVLFFLSFYFFQGIALAQTFFRKQKVPGYILFFFTFFPLRTRRCGSCSPLRAF